MKLPRIMLAAPNSGSGKTLITCGLLQALKNEKLNVTAFKSGPDYIDPMFHTKVIGTPSKNLDSYFADEETLKYLFAKSASKSDISVIEGVMGFYDGLGGISTAASSYDVARITKTPVILVISAKGMSLSVVALLKGIMEYRKDSNIKGVILNNVSEMYFKEMKPIIESELGIKAIGYVPKLVDCLIESRHLGLVTPGEILDLQQRVERLAEVLAESIDIKEIINLANEAEEFADTAVNPPKRVQELLDKVDAEKVKIAVAKDDAFCFYYEDNFELLKSLGAELEFFSPLNDERVPECDGMMFGGGYPELYAKTLSENTSMKKSILENISRGVPYVAECGGFMYLHEFMEDMEKKSWPMVGVVKGSVKKTDRLGRFGYINLTAKKAMVYGAKDIEIKAHEFHYFDSSNNGEDFHAQKAIRKRGWECVIADEKSAVGFPHLYYYSNPEFAWNLINKCKKSR